METKSTGTEYFGLKFFDRKNIQGRLLYENPVNLNMSVTHGNCKIGAYSYLNGEFTRPTIINNCNIGRYCSLAHNIEINPGHHDLFNLATHPFIAGISGDSAGLISYPEYLAILPDNPAKSSNHERAINVEIGNDVWIGCNVIIMAGVKIGDGAVIGAGSVVTKDVPPYMIAAGNSAKKISQRFSDGVIEELLKLQWWDYDIAPIKNEIDFSNINNAIEIIKRSIELNKISLKHFQQYQMESIEDAWRFTNFDTGEIIKVEFQN